jgi:hypothetical protein
VMPGQRKTEDCKDLWQRCDECDHLVTTRGGFPRRHGDCSAGGWAQVLLIARTVISDGRRLYVETDDGQVIIRAIKRSRGGTR